MRLRNAVLIAATIALVSVPGFSPLQQDAPTGRSSLHVPAVQEAALDKACQQQLPADVPLSQGRCAARLICLPGRTKPLEMRVCNDGSPAAEGIAEQESFLAAKPRPAVWRWTREK